MEQAYFGASQLLSWLQKIHIDRNREQFSELYCKLSDYLSTIFGYWSNFSSPDLLLKVIELLSSRSENNLYFAVLRPESRNFHHPFPVSSLPLYVQRLIQSRRLSELPTFYTCYQINLEKNVIVLPTAQFYLFSFMYESCKNRHAEWFESYSFMEFIYNNPFLIIFSHYLQDFDDEMLKFLTQLSQEYIIRDSISQNSSAPSRHNCEMLLALIHTLQKPSNLLLPSFRIVNINPDSILFPLCSDFYQMLRNLCTCWKEGTNTYCSFLLEVWLQILIPWQKNEIMSDFMSSDYCLTPGKKAEKDYLGNENFWEEYIFKNIHLYTDCFGLVLRLMCNEILFRPGDIGLLLRISDVFSVDSEGNLFHGKLSLYKLKQWSKGAPLPPQVEEVVNALNINRAWLNPFFDANLTKIAENLIYRAESLGYPEANDVKKNWGGLLGIRNKGVVVDCGKKGVRINVLPHKSLLNVWEKPVRSDELWILCFIFKYLAWGLDRVRKLERTWPPKTDIRFFASYPNWLFCFLMYFVIRFLFFR